MRPDKNTAARPAGFPERLSLWICVAAVVLTPAVLRGEVLYLKDGSTIRGSVVELVGDTLTFDPAFGGRMRIARSLISSIVFSDASASIPVLPGAGVENRAATGKVEENGFLAVSFKDKSVSSKVVVESATDEARLLRANWIVQALVVNGDTVFCRVDSTTDKTIYKGHARQYKNDAELNDIEVPLASGVYRCFLAAASRGADWKGVEFEAYPLDLSLAVDNLQIFPGRTTRVEIGIKKGRFRLGKPEFYRIQ